MKKTLIAIGLMLAVITMTAAQGPYKVQYSTNKYWAENGTIRTDGWLESYGNGRDGGNGLRLYYQSDTSATMQLTSAGAFSFSAAISASNITNSGLTATRVPYASTGGLLVDASAFTYTTATGNLTSTLYNSLTLASAATGFTIAGGTSSKTLTLDTDLTASAVAPLASPTFTGTVTLPTGLSGFVKASSGVVSASTIVDGDVPSALTGKSVNGATIYTASGAVLADGVLTTTIPSTVAGILCVSETTAKQAYFPMAADVVGATLVVNAAYAVTKDNALTINVYVEDSVVKIQNKTAATINVKVSTAYLN